MLAIGRRSDGQKSSEFNIRITRLSALLITQSRKRKETANFMEIR